MPARYVTDTTNFGKELPRHFYNRFPDTLTEIFTNAQGAHEYVLDAISFINPDLKDILNAQLRRYAASYRKAAASKTGTGEAEAAQSLALLSEELLRASYLRPDRSLDKQAFEQAQRTYKIIDVLNLVDAAPLVSALSTGGTDPASLLIRDRERIVENPHVAENVIKYTMWAAQRLGYLNLNDIAEKTLEAAVSVFPDNTKLLNSYALKLIDANKLEKAASVLIEAIARE